LFNGQPNDQRGGTAKHNAAFVPLSASAISLRLTDWLLIEWKNPHRICANNTPSCAWMVRFYITISIFSKAAVQADTKTRIDRRKASATGDVTLVRSLL
jgi:hypothetical protein